MKIADFITRMNVGENELGFFNGYDFTVTQMQQDFISYPIMHFRFEEMLNNEMLKKLKVAIKGMGNLVIDQCGYVLHYFCSVLTGKNIKDEKWDKFINSLNQLTELFKTIPLTNLTHCVICRKEKDEAIESHMINENLLPTHKTCFEEFKTYHINEVLKNEANVKNYPKSIAFAILGAIIGYLPFLLILLFTNYMLGILFVLIPLASYYGYKMGKAPLNKNSTIVIVVSSLVVFLIGVLLYLLLVQKALGNSFSETLKLCTGDIIYCLIFGLIGIIYSYRIITKDTNENKLKKLK